MLTEKNAKRLEFQLMTSNVMKEPPAIENEVSDQTGQFDPRFVLWRKFCEEHAIPVESLPSQLSGELKQEWEESKIRARDDTKAVDTEEVT